MNRKLSIKSQLKTFVTILGIVAGIATSEAAYMRLQATPYDKQMQPVFAVLNQHSNSNYTVQYEEVLKWMRQIKNYRYSDTNKWHTPAETVRRRAGDCKDKAILLLSYFKEKGCTNVKLVIGKMRPKSKVTHAWVEWKHNGKWIILDPTYDRKPVSSKKEGEYAKQYVFMGAKKYSYVSPKNLMAGL